MAYFDFSRLIEKYNTSFTVETFSEGHYDDSGEWVNGTAVTRTIHGAIIGHKESKIFRSAGTLTAKDKRLFMLEPIENALLGATAIYKGQSFNIEEETENADFTGVYSYLLKFVSAFDKAVSS